MSDDTEVKPMSAECASFILYRCQGLPSGVLHRVEAIADGRHEVIDKATHAKVEHAGLERLRACEADARRLDWIENHAAQAERFQADGIREWWNVTRMIDNGTATEVRLRDAIDAAQQEGSDASND